MDKLLFAVAALTVSGWASAAGTTIPGGNLSLTQTQWSTKIGGAASSNTVSGGPSSSNSTTGSAGVKSSMTGIETYSTTNTTSTAQTSVSTTGDGSGSMTASASSEYYSLAETSGDVSGAGAIGFGGFGGW